MQKVTVEVLVHGSREKIWNYWNSNEHIPGWAFASDDWKATPIENDLREGGKFLTRMGAKDGSVSFDFSGTYTKVVPHSELDYTLDDGRTVTVDFIEEGEETVRIVQEFEMEGENTEEMQRAGWQAFLDNFKKYVEAN